MVSGAFAGVVGGPTRVSKLGALPPGLRPVGHWDGQRSTTERQAGRLAGRVRAQNCKVCHMHAKKTNGPSCSPMNVM